MPHDIEIRPFTWCFERLVVARFNRIWCVDTVFEMTFIEYRVKTAILDSFLEKFLEKYLVSFMTNDQVFMTND